MSNKNPTVSCTDCIHWNDLKQRIENYFGCNTKFCNIKCKCFCCDCNSPNRPKESNIRPNFIKREINDDY